MIRFIGDVHGKFDPYKKIIKNAPVSIQVGDMGVGFIRPGTDIINDPPRFSTNPPYDEMKKGNHRFIRGNHDNPGVCARQKFFIPDGMVENDMMFVGGALSVDKALRYEGYDWWPNEELSQTEWNTIIDIYEVTKPRIMITHECPERLAADHVRYYMKKEFPSITRQAFGVMFDIHKPDFWVYGHWHINLDRVVGGCRFVCLDELCYIDIDPTDTFAGTIVPRKP